MRESTGESAEGVADDGFSGSRSEWGTLYEETGERVYHLVLRMTGDAELAQDVTHDAFVRVYERSAQFDGRGSLRGWVYTIAKNIARDRLRRRKFQVTLFDDEVAPPKSAPARPVDVELRMELDEAIGTLSEEYRTVLLLHDVDGYTHPEIAEMLGLAVGSSRARLSRARAQLRDALDHTAE